jgi:hypothetical protein
LQEFDVDEDLLSLISGGEGDIDKARLNVITKSSYNITIVGCIQL